MLEWNNLGHELVTKENTVFPDTKEVRAKIVVTLNDGATKKYQAYFSGPILELLEYVKGWVAVVQSIPEVISNRKQHFDIVLGCYFLILGHESSSKWYGMGIAPSKDYML